MILRRGAWKWEGSPAEFIQFSEPVPTVEAAIEIFGSIKDSCIFSNSLDSSMEKKNNHHDFSQDTMSQERRYYGLHTKGILAPQGIFASKDFHHS